MHQAQENNDAELHFYHRYGKRRALFIWMVTDVTEIKEKAIAKFLEEKIWDLFFQDFNLLDTLTISEILLWL